MSGTGISTEIEERVIVVCDGWGGWGSGAVMAKNMEVLSRVIKMF